MRAKGLVTPNDDLLGRKQLKIHLQDNNKNNLKHLERLPAQQLPAPAPQLPAQASPIIPLPTNHILHPGRQSQLNLIQMFPPLNRGRVRRAYLRCHLDC